MYFDDLSLLNIPKPPVETTESAVSQYHDEVNKFSEAALNILVSVDQYISRYPLTTTELSEKLDLIEGIDHQLVKIKDVFEKIQSPALSAETIGKLNKVKECESKIKEHILKKNTVLKDIDDLLNTHLPQGNPLYRARIKAEFVKVYGNIDFIPKVVLEQYSSLLKSYPIDKTLSTGIPLLVLSNRHQTDPELTGKVILSTLYMPYIKRHEDWDFVEERKILLDLKSRLPENCLPTFQKLFDKQYFPANDFNSLLPFFEARVKQLDEGADPEKMANNIEKLVVIFKLKQSHSEFQSAIFRGEIDQVLAALDEIKNPENREEISQALQKGGLLQEKADADPQELQSALETINPDIEADVQKWLLNFVAYSGADESRPTDWESCKNSILNQLPKLSQISILNALTELKSQPPEKQKLCLETFKTRPFLALETIRLIAIFEKDDAAKLKSILETHPDIAVRIIKTPQIDNASKIGIIRLKDHLETEFGKEEGSRLWEHLCNDNAIMSRDYLSWVLLSLSKDDLKLSASIFGKKGYGDIVYKLAKAEGASSLLEANPTVKDFWINKGYKLDMDNLLTLLKHAPKLCRDIVENYGGGSDQMLEHALKEIGDIYRRADYDITGSDDVFFSLAQKHYPIQLLEKLASAFSPGQDKIKGLSSITKYVLGEVWGQKEDNSDTEKEQRIKDALALIDFHKVIPGWTVDQVIKTIIKSPESAQKVRALLEKGDYFAITKLVKGTGSLEPIQEQPVSKSEKTLPNAITQSFTFSQNYKTNDDRTAASLEIADYLLLPDGRIDVGKIEVLRNSPSFKELPFSQRIMESLLTSLKCLEDDPQFSNRLSQFQRLPEVGIPPPMHNLLKKMLGKDEINLHDTRKAVLSGLIWPTRQAEIGSCFSTSIIIQGEKYPAGLRQKMEDFFSMITKGVITCAARDLFVSTDIPVYVEELIHESAFEKDHLLNRAREFTIASSGARVGAGKLPLPSHFAGVLNQKLHKEEFIEYFNESFAITLQSRFDWVFDPVKKSPSSGNLGAWCLYNKIDNQFITSMNAFRQQYLSICEDLTKQLIEKYPLYELELTEALYGADGMMNWIKGDDFIGRSYPELSFQEATPALMSLNPLRHQQPGLHSPWLNYGGMGNPFDVVGTYLGGSDKARGFDLIWSEPEEGLKLVLDECINLPLPIRNLCATHPEFSTLFSCSWGSTGHAAGHAFSLRPKDILQLSELHPTSEKMIEEFQKQSTGFAKRIIDEAQVLQILEIMKKKNETDPFMLNVLSHLEISRAKSLEALWAMLKESFSQRGLNSHDERLEYFFLQAIYESDLKKDAPRIHIGDTNCEPAPDFLMAANPTTGSFSFAFANPDLSIIDLPLNMNVMFFPTNYAYHNPHNIVEAQL